MTPDQQKAVLEFILGRIPYETLVERTALDPVGAPSRVHSLLRETITSRDADALEAVLLLAFRFDLLSPEFAPLLASLLLEPWHRMHEDLARVLQDLRVASTAKALAEAAVMKHQYLEYDDSLALARKCIWALAAIGTPESRGYLEELASKPDLELAAYAQKRLGNDPGGRI